MSSVTQRPPRGPHHFVADGTITYDDGRTALHLAAGEGKLRVASKLVELGADVKKADRQGRNALDIARAAGYYDLEARLRLLAET